MRIKSFKKFPTSPKIAIFNRLQKIANSYQEEQIRKSLAVCGEQTSFQIPVWILGADKVKIGKQVSIAAFVHIWGQGGIEIGDNTLIASHVAITSLTHDTAANLFAESLIAKPVVIGRNVWIGSHAVILPGVRVGDGAVIGAGAVVNKDVSADSIVVGVPAKLLRNRFQT